MYSSWLTPHHDGEGVILGRGREDDLLDAAVNVGLGLLLSEENTGGLAEVLDAGLVPSDVLGLAGTGGDDALAIDNEVIAIDNHGAIEAAVDGVVLELVRHVVRGGGASVHVEELGLRVLDHDAGHETADTAEAVDAAVDRVGHNGTNRGRLTRGKRAGEGRARGKGGGRGHGADSKDGESSTHLCAGGKHILSVTAKSH